MKRKNWALLLLCAVLLTSALCPSVYAAANDLVDLPAENHWSYRPILWAYDRGVTAGIDETHFGPHEQLTRAQVVMMIWRLHKGKMPVNGGKPLPFVDVEPAAYYYKALTIGWNYGWMAGVSEDRFGPNELCTRAQLVAILGRAFPIAFQSVLEDEKAPIKDVRDFVDVAPGSYYYYDVARLSAIGVIAGVDDSHFGPNEPCTRDQFVTILYRFADYLLVLD